MNKLVLKRENFGTQTRKNALLGVTFWIYFCNPMVGENVFFSKNAHFIEKFGDRG
jgi:hypothetical protein